jgi:hypothetical protein
MQRHVYAEVLGCLGCLCSVHIQQRLYWRQDVLDRPPVHLLVRDRLRGKWLYRHDLE